MHRLILGALVGLVALGAPGEFADYHFVPPSTKAPAPQEGPVAASALLQKLGEDFPRFTIDTYAGQNEILKMAAPAGKALQVGAGVILDWADTPLFNKAAWDGGRYHWRVAIQSVDALALRIQVDLGALHTDDALWVVDTAGNAALGPYFPADADPESGTLWMPTTMGDEAVLWVSTAGPAAPQVAVRALSHFYESPDAKQGLPCPLPADCLPGTALREISTGIGRLSVTHDNASTFLCSGALINNANTAALEPYFLTADHCFTGSPSPLFASGLEVIWDFRANGCDGTEPTRAQLSQFPRSLGSAFLGNSTTIDAMLVRLAGVPVGARGRAWLGWDTRRPAINESVIGIHHPDGRAMKAAVGTVTQTGVNSSLGINQTTLSWTDGITEGGSSGSPSLFNNGDFRIFGVLSNGNVQFCRGFGERLDQYSSFRDFFGQIGGFLVDEVPPGAGRNTYSQNNTGGGGNGGGGGGGPSGCVLNPARSAAAAGDILVGGLALMVLAAFRGAGRLRRP